MPEVAGDAGILIDPNKIEDIAKNIKKVLTNSELQDKLRNLGHKQAKKFSWKKCAQETLSLYQEVYK